MNPVTENLEITENDPGFWLNNIASLWFCSGPTRHPSRRTIWKKALKKTAFFYWAIGNNPCISQCLKAFLLSNQLTYLRISEGERNQSMVPVNETAWHLHNVHGFWLNNIASLWFCSGPTRHPSRRTIWKKALKKTAFFYWAIGNNPCISQCLKAFLLSNQLTYLRISEGERNQSMVPVNETAWHLHNVHVTAPPAPACPGTR